MTGTLAASTFAPRTSRPGRRGIVRLALAALATLVLFAATHRAAVAQTTPRQSKWEFLVSSGAIAPTGAQRAAIKRGNLSVAQLSYAIRPALALTAALGWARSRDVAAAGAPRLDVFTYDLGAEARGPRWQAGRGVTFRPFAGAGAGARSYDYRGLDARATHNLAAYGSVGGEIGLGRVRLRLEVRDYVTGFKPLDGVGAADTRNDVVVLAGLRFVKR